MNHPSRYIRGLLERSACQATWCWDRLSMFEGMKSKLDEMWHATLSARSLWQFINMDSHRQTYPESEKSAQDVLANWEHKAERKYLHKMHDLKKFFFMAYYLCHCYSYFYLNNLGNLVSEPGYYSCLRTRLCYLSLGKREGDGFTFNYTALGRSFFGNSSTFQRAYQRFFLSVSSQSMLQRFIISSRKPRSLTFFLTIKYCDCAARALSRYMTAILSALTLRTSVYSPNTLQ